MKHIRSLSQGSPARAAAWQDVLCAIMMALNAILEAFGGASPVVGLINDKCYIPTPNPPDEGTS